MADSSALRTFDPLLSSSFGVTLSVGGAAVGNFAAVDGLSVEHEMIECRDSACPNRVVYRQGRAKPARVTFKRGMLVGCSNNILFNWISKAQNEKVDPIDIQVSIGGKEGEGKKNTLTLNDCMPTKWSLSSLEGTSNSALMESFEVVVSSISNS